MVTKSAVRQYLQNYVSRASGCYISKVETIDENPQNARHACLRGGVVFYLPFAVCAD